MKNGPLENLPNFIQAKILSTLSKEDLNAIRLASKGCARLTNKSAQKMIDLSFQHEKEENLDDYHKRPVELLARLRLARQKKAANVIEIMKGYGAAGLITQEEVIEILNKKHNNEKAFRLVPLDGVVDVLLKQHILNAIVVGNGNQDGLENIKISSYYLKMGVKIACGLGHHALVDSLIKQNSILFRPRDSFSAPLNTAARYDQIKIVEMLLKTRYLDKRNFAQKLVPWILNAIQWLLLAFYFTPPAFTFVTAGLFIGSLILSYVTHPLCKKINNPGIEVEVQLKALVQAVKNRAFRPAELLLNNIQKELFYVTWSPFKRKVWMKERIQMGQSAVNAVFDSQQYYLIALFLDKVPAYCEVPKRFKTAIENGDKKLVALFLKRASNKYLTDEMLNDALFIANGSQHNDIAHLLSQDMETRKNRQFTNRVKRFFCGKPEDKMKKQALEKTPSQHFQVEDNPENSHFESKNENSSNTKNHSDQITKNDKIAENNTIIENPEKETPTSLMDYVSDKCNLF